MADTRLHDLTDGVAPQSGDEFYVARSPYSSGNDYKLTFSEIQATITTLPTGYLGGVATAYTGTTSTSFTGCGNHAATVGGEAISDFPLSGDGAEQLAALSVNTAAVSTSGVQSVGGFFGATNNSTQAGGGAVSPDACGMYAVGTLSGAGANGVAMGAVLIGSRGASTTGNVTAAQVFSSNLASDATRPISQQTETELPSLTPTETDTAG